MSRHVKPGFRSRAVLLHWDNRSQLEAARVLQKRYHQEASVEEVRKAYFPKRGPFAISNLAGLEVEDAFKVIRRLAKNRKTIAEKLQRLNRDPVFAAARDERGRERLRRLHGDPVFAAARDKRLRRLNRDPVFAAANAERLRGLNLDPEFRARRMAGLQRFWRDYRLRKVEAWGGPTGWEGPSGARRLVRVDVGQEEAITHDFLREEILKAFRALRPMEKAVAAEEYDLGYEHGQDTAALSQEQRTALLNSALAKLRKNNKLAQWLK